MISPLRFIRRLMQLPGNIERIAERASRVDDLSSALHHMHGEVRALRLDQQEQKEEAAIIMKTVTPALESIAGALRHHDEIFEESQKHLLSLAHGLPQSQERILNLLKELNDNENTIERTKLLQHILEELHKTDMRPVTEKIQKMEDYLCDIKNNSSLLDALHPLKDIISDLRNNVAPIKDMVTDIKNNTDDLRKGGFLTQVEENTERIIAGDARAKNPRWLGHFENQVFSQNGEDGVIEEIFERIGSGSKTFMEIGVSDGLECNTTALLLKGWNGYWVEQDKNFTETIREKFEGVIYQGRLHLIDKFVTAENIEKLMAEAHVPQDIDLLSIDIDGNDYWIWKAMESVKPRAVVIEYNAVMKPPIDWVMAYNPNFRWNGSRHYGASLTALQKLAEQKGYALVGCEITGNNAFFVRKDLISDAFMKQVDAASHYQPPRYHLVHTVGHKRDFGSFTHA